MSFKYAPLISCSEPHSASLGWLFFFKILPKGNAESSSGAFSCSISCTRHLLCLFGGRSRLYWNCLISNLLTCTFHIDCNTSTDMVFRKCAQAEKELSQKLHKLWHTWTKMQSFCIQMSSRVANKGGKKDSSKPETTDPLCESKDTQAHNRLSE